MSVLAKTFIHIPGIGRQTERDLWTAGITSWDRWGNGAPVSASLRRRLQVFIPQSVEAVQKKNAAFFGRLSRLGESWRLFPEFVSQCVYLDIETTGLSPVFDTITMVGLYDGRRYETFIEGQNLEELPERLRQYSVLVTFNGSGFDLRFLNLAFRNLTLPPVHIDLRWVTRRLGCRGGLKSVEREFGIVRDGSVHDVDGYQATVLWARHLRGDPAALQGLIAYNSEDVVHLKAIMEIAYDRLAKEVGGELWNEKAIYAGLAVTPKTIKALKRSTIKPEPLVTRLIQRSQLTPPKIVGIDLTGSERRASGWALLEGASARTKSILTDDELLHETLAVRPHLVSIDSPLSVPEGWDNTQRQLVHGAPIYRKCELALKRMGISVFWCLLPSMRSLTMRGMRLADELRKRGVRVIESYPGAAQDILSIPRKGSSLQELKCGLNGAGIRGDYVEGRVTHDEVDAITSALVGLFYLADDYLALGTAGEDYLIVPRSPRTNYEKLAEIVAASGLDEPNRSAARAVECNLHVGSAAVSTFG